ncbi:FAD-dependent urate hydroxylase [Microdochium nivale]|nr:FAD-dependent urate hydroxylase [Microdochium nivale]
MAPLKVAIVGGGMAGANLANGLINKSSGLVQVTVYERAVESDAHGGYQIRLGALALAGFRACLTPKQFGDLLLLFGQSSGAALSAPCIFNPSDMRVLVDLSTAPTYEKSAPISRIRLRDYLQEPLKEKGVIKYGMKCTSYEILKGSKPGRSRVRVHFADGTHDDSDILIAAEGSGSKINKQIGLDNIVERALPGGDLLLGKCNLSWDVLLSLPKGLLEKGSIYTSNSAGTIFAAAYLPPSLSTPERRDAVSVSVSGWDKPLRYDEQQASLYLVIGWSTDELSKDFDSRADKKAYLRQKLARAGFHPEFHKLVDAVDEDELVTTPSRSSKLDTRIDWRGRLLASGDHEPEIANPRVWLIGDSIHVMLPSRGMGANNALCDTADALPPLLQLAEQHSSAGFITDDEVFRQLAKYEQVMVPRAFGWVKKSMNQKLPDLESTKGKMIVVVLRIGIFFQNFIMGILKFIGWQPKDDAPEFA